MSSMLSFRTIAILVLLTCFSGVLCAQNQPRFELEGLVADSFGNPVSGAVIEIRHETEVIRCISDNQGKFKCVLNAVEKLTISIRADGFSILRQFVANIQELESFQSFILKPADLREEVVVSILAAETSVEETPASVVSLSSSDLESSPAAAVDDALRNSVGFSLFRRSGSKTANPTTQGTSLRGINSSGASRSTVSFDGIPLNDPFGGWVTWSRVPKLSVERIEIIRGGASSLFGSGSLGGNVGIVQRKAANGFASNAEVSLGSQNTGDGSFFAGFGSGNWSADTFGALFTTKGYRIVARDERGPVDDFANSRNSNASVRVGRTLGKQTSLSAKAHVFGEGRNNGTPAQKNRTHLREFSVGTDIGLEDIDRNLKSSRLVLRAYGSTQVFDQTFSAVNTDRTAENLVRLQRVPSQRVGYSAVFNTFVFGNTLIAGFEGSQTRGSSNETGFFGGSATSAVGSGGTEEKLAFFVQDFVQIGNSFYFGGAIRFDRWKNRKGLSHSRSLINNSSTTNIFPDRSASAISPTGSILYRISEKLVIYGSVGRSFRAPTLNELYRGFRVGNVVTNPNAFLESESAANIEVGARYSSRKLYLQASVSKTTIENAVANVTLSPGPGLIIRERRNAGETRTVGFETEAEYRGGIFRLKAGLLLLDATVRMFDSDPQLVGLRVPQVPVSQFTFQTGVMPSDGWNFVVQGRAASNQFDDDSNTFALGSYFQADVYVSKQISEKITVFSAVENLFDSSYTVGKTPLRTVSAPFSVRFGMRWQ